MTAKGYNIFLAYSDPEAGEIGTVYQACNWLYCGLTGTTEKFRTADGRVYDARQVHGRTRDRSGGTMKYKRSRAEERQLLLEKGCEFYTDTGRKHRYVGIYGDRRMKRRLRAALNWAVFPYPKRHTSSAASLQAVYAVSELTPERTAWPRSRPYVRDAGEFNVRDAGEFTPEGVRRL